MVVADLEEVDDPEALRPRREPRRVDGGGGERQPPSGAEGEHPVQGAAAGGSERRLADVVRERDDLGEVLVETEVPGQAAGRRGNLQGVRQAGPHLERARGREELRLVAEAAEGAGVDQPVAVPLERPAPGQPPPAVLGREAAGRPCGVARQGGSRRAAFGGRGRRERAVHGWRL